ncbi:MAG: 50S ribosomal protein L11 methyltransferase [Thermodesulfovibrionales bacterium]|nr:50S ribosomal protein L11 methyltransferase [Thermodesulfovibrionales bacterium]
MGYYEFHIKVSQVSIDALIERLSEIGCLGIIVDDNSLVVYFPDLIFIDKVERELHNFKKVLQDSGLSDDISYKYEYISEKDWNESWKKTFQPIDVGERLTILPPWQEGKPDRINLIIDPGMAFGTGHHETTVRCLSLIEELSKELPSKDSFLDIGTGTGILAIAASKLGFSYVLGLDIDPLAIDAAKRNINLNDLKNVDIQCWKLENVEKSFDFIVANLLSDTLIALSSEIVAHLKSTGIMVLSGIIEGQEADIIKVYERHSIDFFKKIVDGKWVTLAAKIR